jgi:hypothetical protein
MLNKNNIYFFVTSFIFSYFLNFNIYSETKYFEVKGLSKEITDILYGVWVNDINKSKLYVDKFSWGFSYTDVMNGYISFDFSNSKQILFAVFGQCIDFKIISGEKINSESYRIFIESDRLYPEQKEIKITILNKNKIQIQIKSNALFSNEGIFYKSGGPDIVFYDFYTPKSNELKLFKQTSEDSSIIKLIKKDEKLVIYYKSRDFIEINNQKVYWLSVSTLEDEDGFCLESDLEKLNSENGDRKLTTFYIPLITTLRFHETPGNNGKFIRMLNKNEKLLLLEKGKEDVISGVKGQWYKVKTEKEEIGWCFSGYLEEKKYDESSDSK